jgi:hypothetical protein
MINRKYSLGFEAIDCRHERKKERTPRSTARHRRKNGFDSF